jgi:hypothetical protein
VNRCEPLRLQTLCNWPVQPGEKAYVYDWGFYLREKTMRRLNRKRPYLPLLYLLTSIWKSTS